MQIKTLTVGLAATLLFLVLITLITRSLDRTFEEISTEELRLQRLIGTIVHLDEVLTMSARMAAQTGDAAWEQRYRRFEPRLEQAIAEAKRLEGEDGAAARTEGANLRLVEAENRAFELVRVGRPEDAAALLQSEVYLADKLVYASAMEELAGAIDGQIARARESVGQAVFREGLLAGASALVLLGAWLRVFFVIRAQLRNRDEAEERRLKLEAQIAGAQRLESLSVLAGGVAHDFNNLLTGILANASAAQRVLPAGHLARERIAEVIGGSKLAAHLTGQLLTYAGERRLRVRALDLSAELRGIEPVLRGSVRALARLHVEAESGLPAVVADPVQIHQVLMNLVLNAAQSSPHQVEVRVRTRGVELGARDLERLAPGSAAKPGRYVALEVEDDGEGMSASVCERVFDPFFTTKEAGHGLGLAATLGIVHGHGGGILLESEPAKGTRFCVLFPASDEVVEDRGVERPGSLAGGGRILVVDDDEFVLQAAYLSLESYGYSAVLAASGAEAVDVFRERASEFTLVILDHSMPGMSGEQTLAALREIRAEIPVLLSTGSLAAELAGCPVLRKPYEPEELAAAVREQLGGGDAARPAELDQVLDELREAYRERLPDRLEALAAALRAGERQKGLRLAHSLRGTVGSYGFAELADVIGQVELELERGDLESALDLMRTALASSARENESGSA